MNKPAISSIGLPVTISSICSSPSSYTVISRAEHFLIVTSASTACGPPSTVKIFGFISFTAVIASNAGFAKGVNAVNPTKSGLCFFTAWVTS